jgi:hypothetical protein
LPQKSVTNTQVYFNKRQLLKAKSTLNDWRRVSCNTPQKLLNSVKDKIWLSWEYFAQKENRGRRRASHVVSSPFVGISHVRSKSRAIKFSNFQIILCAESTTAMASASRVAAKILNRQWRQPKVFRCRRFGRFVTIFIVKERHVMSKTGVWALVRDQWRKFQFLPKQGRTCSTHGVKTPTEYTDVRPQLELASAANRTESYSLWKKL